MLEIRKKVILLEVLNKLIIQKSFRDFTNKRKKINRGPTFLNIETINETFQQSGKYDSFRHILKSSASIYKHSGSPFSENTGGIQSEPDYFRKSGLIMTFLKVH